MSSALSTPGGWPWVVALLVPLNLELLLRVLPTGALAERREELYGFLSLLALLLVLLTRVVRPLRPHRRTLGLLAFVYGLAHGWLAVAHVLQGDLSNLLFLNRGIQASGLVPILRRRLSDATLASEVLGFKVDWPQVAE